MAETQTNRLPDRNGEADEVRTRAQGASPEAARHPAELAQLYHKVGIAAVAAAVRYHNTGKIAGGNAPRRSLHAA